MWKEVYRACLPSLVYLLTFAYVPDMKHVLAPRASTQAEMNLAFQGTFYNLGERYTDLTKVLFVVFFYSALYPLAFFFGAAILFVQYYVRSPCRSSHRIVSIANSRTQPYMLAFF